MKRIISIILSFAMVVNIAFGTFPFTLTAKASEEKNDVAEEKIWNDDFSVNSITDYHVTGPDNGIFGDWKVVDDKLQVAGTSACTNWWTTAVLLKDVTYDDFVMEFDADVSTGYGVIFRAQDNGTTTDAGLNTWFSGNAYVLMHHNPVDSSNGQYMSLRNFNGSDTVIKNFSDVGTMGATSKVHWKLVVNGDDITVTVYDIENPSNTYTYTWTDTTYTSGSIGFYNTTINGFTSLKVDNLSVKPLDDVYTNEFTDTATISDFFVAGPDAGAWGNWQIADGLLKVTGNTGANWWGTSVLTNEKYDDFTMEFDAYSAAGYGVILRAENKNGLNSWYGGEAYTAMHWNPINDTNSSQLQIVNYDGSNPATALKDNGLPGNMASMTKMHWVVSCFGEDICITVNNIDHPEERYSIVLKDDKYDSGYVGFYSLTAAGVNSLSVDNLKIDGFKKATTTDPDQGEGPELKDEKAWTDDFTEDSIANYHATGPDNGILGNWKVENGQLQVTGSSVCTSWWTTAIILKDASYSDFVMEFDAEVSTGYGVIFRAEDDGTTTGSGLNTWFGGNGYVLMHHNPVDAGNGEYMSLRDFNGSDTVIKNFSDVGTMGVMSKVHWKLVVDGDDITVTVYDIENPSNSYTYTWTDTTYTSGSIGFYNTTINGFTSLKVDNLNVRPLDDVYTNEFTDTAAISDFFVAGPDAGAWGDWKVADGQLKVTGKSGADWWGTSALTNEKYDDFTMEFDAYSTAGYGVILRAGSKEGLNGWFGGDAYTVMHWNPTDASTGRQLQIVDYNGANPPTVLKSSGGYGSVPSMEAMHWVISCLGDDISITISNINNPAERYTMTLKDSKYANGYVGFYSLTKDGINTLRIDNLDIDGYQKAEEGPEQGEEAETWIDDFSKDTILDYQVTGPENGKFGNWKVENGKLSLTGSAACTSWWTSAILLKDVSYSDFVMEFDAEVSTGYGVIFRAEDDGTTTGSGLNTWFGGNGYVLMHHNPVDAGNGEYMSLRDFNGSDTAIKNFSDVGTMGAMSKIHWKIVASGDDVNVTVYDIDNPSNTYTYAWTDTTYSKGSIGFYNTTINGYNSLNIDNLSVKPLKTLYNNEFTDAATISDFFTAGPDAGNWGNWEVTGGQLKVTGRNGADWWGTSGLTNKKYDNFTMEFDAYSSAGYGVLFRAGSKDGLNGWFGGDAYMAMHWNPTEAGNGRQLQIIDYDGSNPPTVLKSSGGYGSVPSMNAIHWVISCFGDDICITITNINNSAESYTCVLKDSSYAKGYVGFYSLTKDGINTLSVDSLVINGFEEALTTDPDVNEDDNSYVASDKQFVDDFETDSLDKYIVAGEDNGAQGIWKVEEGKLSLTPETSASKSTAALVLKDAAYNNFVAEFEGSATGTYGFFFRAQDDAASSGTGLNDKFGGKGYLFLYNYKGEKELSLLKLNGKETILEEFGKIESTADTLFWKISADGSNLYAAITDAENNLLVDAATINANYTIGTLGLYGVVSKDDEAITFDNLKITPLVKVLYENDFASEDSLDDFIIAGPDNGIHGEWEVVDGMLQVTGTKSAENWYGASAVVDKLFADYVMEFDAKVSSGYGIFFRAADDAASENYGLNQWFGGNTYAMMHWNAQNSESGRYTELYNYSGFGSYSLIEKFCEPGEMSILSDVHWKIIAWGGTLFITVSSNIDSSVSYTYIVSDDTYTTGRIGFYNLTHDGVTSFKMDNLVVRGLEYGTQPFFSKYETGEYLWEDDFSTEKADSYIERGEWKVQSGKLVCEGNKTTGYAAYYLKQFLTDFTVEFDVSNKKDVEYSLLFRAGTAAYSENTGDGYILTYADGKISAAKLYGQKEAVRKGTFLYSVPEGVEITHWKVECIGTAIKLYINGEAEPVITFNDHTYSIGRVGLRVASAEKDNRVTFDNLKVSGYKYVSGITSTNIYSCRGDGEIYDTSIIEETPKRENVEREIPIIYVEKGEVTQNKNDEEEE